MIEIEDLLDPVLDGERLRAHLVVRVGDGPIHYCGRDRAADVLRLEDCGLTIEDVDRRRAADGSILVIVIDRPAVYARWICIVPMSAGGDA